MRLAGKIARSITGGARGIGRAIAEGLRARGRDALPSPTSMQRRAKDGGPAIGAKAYAVETRRHEPGLDRRHGEGSREAGRAASTFSSTMPRIFDLAPIVEITETSYDRLFAVNVEGHCCSRCRPSAKRMIARGTRRQDHQHGLPGRTARRAAGRASIAPPRRPSSASPSRPASR